MSGTVGRVVDVLFTLGVLGLILSHAKEFGMVIESAGGQVNTLYKTATLQAA